MVGREGSEAVWSAQQHKPGHGRRGLGEHCEENCKLMNAIRYSGVQIKKCISFVSRIPSSYYRTKTSAIALNQTIYNKLLSQYLSISHISFFNLFSLLQYPSSIPPSLHKHHAHRGIRRFPSCQGERARLGGRQVKSHRQPLHIMTAAQGLCGCRLRMWHQKLPKNLQRC